MRWLDIDLLPAARARPFGGEELIVCCVKLSRGIVRHVENINNARGCLLGVGGQGGAAWDRWPGVLAKVWDRGLADVLACDLAAQIGRDLPACKIKMKQII